MNQFAKYRRLFSLIIVMVLLIASTVSPALAVSIKATINTAGAKVYRSPTTSSTSLTAAKGLTVTVSGYSGGWAHIAYKGKSGYIRISNLSLKNRITAYTYKETEVHRNASSSSETIRILSAGTKVYITGVSGDYARITNKSGSVTGYVESDELASRAQMKAAYAASQGSSSASKVNKATALAVSFVGRPYGTHEPSSFNCSSLVNYCFEKYGYKMKGSAADIAKDGSYKKITGYSSCKRGDILCFDSDNDGVCDHVSIYIGDGYFVEASQNAGKVQINSVSSWYKSHFMWARRVGK